MAWSENRPELIILGGRYLEHYAPIAVASSIPEGTEVAIDLISQRTDLAFRGETQEVIPSSAIPNLWQGVTKTLFDLNLPDGHRARYAVIFGRMIGAIKSYRAIGALIQRGLPDEMVIQQFRQTQQRAWEIATISCAHIRATEEATDGRFVSDPDLARTIANTSPTYRFVSDYLNLRDLVEGSCCRPETKARISFYTEAFPNMPLIQRGVFRGFNLGLEANID